MPVACPICSTPHVAGAPTCENCGHSSAPTALTDTPNVRAPTLPPRYEVRELLGRGAMGEVYLCRDVELDVDVAVKILPWQLSPDKSAHARIRTEARAAAKLRDGAGIVSLHAFEQYAGTWFLVMDHAVGGSLEERLEREGKLPEAECRRLGAEIADALAFAHSRGVLHRDVKTANILLDGDGHALVADFGIAKVLADAAQHLTNATIAGTPVYMAPETMWRGSADARSDLYSLGCLLHEISTGTTPWDGDFSELLGSKTDPDAAPPDPRDQERGLSAEFAAVVSRLLARDPERRFQRAEAVATALRGGATERADRAVHVTRRAPRAPAPRPLRPEAAAPDVGTPTRPALTRRLKAMLGVTALAASVCLAFAVWSAGATEPATLGAPSSPSKEEPAATEPAPMGVLDPSAMPAEVEVLVDGERFACDAGPIDVPAGEHVVACVRWGFEVPPSRTVTVPANGTLGLDEPTWNRTVKSIAAVPELPAPTVPLPAGLKPPAGCVLIDGRIFSERDGAELALVPAGEFMMGDDEGPPNQRPAHRVHVSAFLMDRHEVTNAQFRRFVEATGYETVAEQRGGSFLLVCPGQPNPWTKGLYWRHPTGLESTIEQRDHYPVTNINRADALAYAKWVGRRLPTEAEFEKALRSGLDGAKFPWGDDEVPNGRPGNIADEQLRAWKPAWDCGVRGYDDGFASLAPVGSCDANAYGVFDLAGNAFEWVSDWYGRDYYRESPHRDPTGPRSGKTYVIRGSNWINDGLLVTSARRWPTSTRWLQSNFSGFRCVQDLEQRRR